MLFAAEVEVFFGLLRSSQLRHGLAVPASRPTSAHGECGNNTRTPGAPHGPPQPLAANKTVPALYCPCARPYAVAPAVALTAVMISFVATSGCETIEAWEARPPRLSTLRARP